MWQIMRNADMTFSSAVSTNIIIYLIVKKIRYRTHASALRIRNIYVLVTLPNCKIHSVGKFGVETAIAGLVVQYKERYSNSDHDIVYNFLGKY